MLISHGCNVDAKTDKGRTALMMAAASGHSDCVYLLMKANAKLDAKDSKGRDALTMAREAGYRGIAERIQRALKP